jgi:hypothetical protein
VIHIQDRSASLHEILQTSAALKSPGVINTAAAISWDLFERMKRAFSWDHSTFSTNLFRLGVLSIS